MAEHPREVFGSEAFDFDLGVYGDRVVSIGEFLAPDLPFSLSSGRKWLPPEGTVEEDGREGSAHKTETFHLKEKDYPELFLKVSDALDRGEKWIVLGSQEVELTPEFLDYVDQLKAKAAEKQTDQVQGPEKTHLCKSRKISFLRNIILGKQNGKSSWAGTVWEVFWARDSKRVFAPCPISRWGWNNWRPAGRVVVMGCCWRMIWVWGKPCRLLDSCQH